MIEIEGLGVVLRALKRDQASNIGGIEIGVDSQSIVPWDGEHGESSTYDGIPDGSDVKV